MMKYFLSFLMMMVSLVNHAQSTNDHILFTVDGQPVYTSEFERVFKKNLDLVKDESQKDIDEYLKLFINYKLKLREAKALGLDEKESYKKELESYKNQLASGYLTDNKVTNELVEEAYDRTQYEIEARHVLIRLDGNASPADTLKVYEKLLNIKDRIKNEGFEKIQKELHDGRTIFAEDLGYFSAFKMVYNFETAAYNTPLGEISQPFKTRFGYHIVEVLNKRKARGSRQVGHIMILSNQKEEAQGTPEERINDIYQKIQQGEEFETLAKQFSDDKSSANNGGKLAPFQSGELSSPEFEEQAFSLTEIGQISKPFKSQFGWHIVKLYEIHPVETFDVMRPELEAKVKKDSRSQLINEKVIENLKKQYGVIDPSLDEFSGMINDEFYKGRWTLPGDFDASKPFVKIGKEQLTYGDFGSYLIGVQKRRVPKMEASKLVEMSYDQFISQELMTYKKEHLEEENQEYANIVSEYRDGLLLFDLMESYIWNVSKSDTTELKNYFDLNKSKYMWEERVDAVVASSADKSIIKEVSKLLKNGKSPSEIKETLNKDGQVNVIFTSGIMEKNHQSLPVDFKFETGVSKIYSFNDSYIVALIKEVMPKASKSYKEAKGAVISDFQSYKEEMWIKELEQKYKVVINQEALDQVKKELKG